MALSLAACGGSSDTAVAVVEEPAATTPVVEEPVVEEPVVEEPVVVEPVVTALTAGADTTGTDGDDSFTATTGPLTADKTIVGTDDIAGGTGSDTIAISLGADFGGFTTTGTDTGSMVGVEVVELSTADTLARTFDATGVSGVETYKIDGTNAVVSITDSADLSNLELSNIASGAFSITYTAPTGGTSPVAGTADTLNLTVQGLGSATADIAITAAGAETLAVTSNAAATAAGATNYLDTTSVGSTTVTVTGAADTDFGAVSTSTTSFDASASTGAITAALGNAAAGALTSVKTGSGDDAVTAAYGDLTANATIDLGTGADTLTLTGATAAAVSQFVMSGVETLDVTSLTGAATTVSLAKATTVPTDMIAGLSKTGADVNFAGSLDFVGDSGAKNIDLIGASTGTITTDTTGAIDVDVTANSAATAAALNANTGTITTANAGSMDLSVTGNVDYTGAMTAAKATTLTVTNAGGAQSGMKLSAVKAETVSITTDKNLTLSDGNTTLTGAKTVTIDAAGAFVQDDAGATDTEGFTATQTMTLSGAGSKAAATFDSLVGAADLAYSMTINASGLKGGLTFGADVDAGTGSLTVGASAVTGAVDMSKMDAAGTVTFTASSLGANTLDVITAKSVVINGSEALGGISYTAGNDIVAGSSVTIDGPTVSATDVDIIASATATALTVDVDGGIVADNIDVTGTTTVASMTIKGDAGVGTDVYRIALADYGTNTTSTVTVDMSGVVADTANQSDVQIDIQAEATNALSITGSKGSDDTVVFTNTYSTAKAITLSGVEKMLIDDATTMLAATLSGQTIDLTGTAGGEVVTLNGTAGADTITLANVTIGTGNDPVITIDAGLGADTITLGAVTETVSFADVSTAANGDTVKSFTVGTDLIGLDIALTTDGTAAAGVAVVEDEAVAAANGNGTAYNLDGLLAATTSTVDLVTLDTAVLANIANADLSAATDGTELLKALVAAGAGNTADALTMGTDGDKVYIAVDDGTDGYLYLVQEGADGDVEAVAADIALIATFDSAATFGDIVAAQTLMMA
jgi:hypothetical protein